MPPSGAHKGPSDAVIRQASLDEAFGDDDGAGMIPKAERNMGSAGSVRGIRLAIPDAPSDGTVTMEPDSRAAKHAAERARRLALQRGQPPVQPRRERTVAGSPRPEGTVQATPLEPEDWELPAASPIPQAPVQRRQRRTAGNDDDFLGAAKRAALQALAALPEGIEITVGGNGLNAEGVQFVTGLGLLVGERKAAYRGGNCYRITAAGRTEAAFMEDDDA